MGYSEATRNMALSLYGSGAGSWTIERALGISSATILSWTSKEGINRGPQVADESNKSSQHARARNQKLLPIAGQCELCNKRKATQRLRIDHTTLPLSRDLIVLACGPCNKSHTAGRISITFKHPETDEWICMVPIPLRYEMIELFSGHAKEYATRHSLRTDTSGYRLKG